MFKNNKNNNTLALEFNKGCAPILDEISEPLFKNFGITHFGNLRFFDNNKLLRIANNQLWSQVYFENEFFDDLDMYTMKSLSENEQKYCILADGPKNEHEKMLCLDYNIWNFLFISQRFSTHGDFWFFGTTRDNLGISNFYINNIHILQQFINHVKSKTADLFETTDSSKMISTKINPLREGEAEQGAIDEFLDEISYNKYYLKGKCEGKYFSKREAECLYYASQGKTIKEIALLLNLSSRTIETYLNLAKNKIGGRTKGELISTFKNGRSPFI